MDKTQEAHFSALLRYLKGDECKLRSYLEPLPYCVNAFDVVYKVIRPIYMNEYGDDITSESIRKKAFYGPLAALASNVVPGRPVKPATLYYHICENVGSWEKARREKLEDDRKNCVDVRVTRRNDGSADVCLRIPAEQVPAGLMEMLGRIVGLGYASMREKILKHFDARGADRTLEVRCARWLVPDVLAHLETYAPDVRLGYRSANVAREGLTVGETFSMVEAEGVEEHE